MHPMSSILIYVPNSLIKRCTSKIVKSNEDMTRYVVFEIKLLRAAS